MVASDLILTETNTEEKHVRKIYLLSIQQLFFSCKINYTHAKLPMQFEFVKLKFSGWLICSILYPFLLFHITVFFYQIQKKNNCLYFLFSIEASIIVRATMFSIILNMKKIIVISVKEADSHGASWRRGFFFDSDSSSLSPLSQI